MVPSQGRQPRALLKQLPAGVIPLLTSKVCSQRTRGRIEFWLLHFGMKIESFLGLLGFGANERVVEYPWVLRNLQLEAGSKILDLGVGESRLPDELSSRGYSVYAVDIKQFREMHPDIKFYKTDARNLPFPHSFFDAVLLISTIEHIGLGAYGDPDYTDGDLNTMEEVKRVLKRDGKMLLTTPYAKSYLASWQRIYDYDRLRRLVSGLCLEKEEYFREWKGRWLRVSEKMAEVDPSDTANAIACLVLKKVEWPSCGPD